jgi:hypothetical protein
MAFLVLVPFLSLLFATLPSATSYAACDTAAGEYAGIGPNDPKGATDTNKCYKDQKVGNDTVANETGNTVNGGAPGQSGQRGGANQTPPDGTTCAIEKVGWLVCPASEFMGEIADTLYDKFIEELLVIEELNLNTTDNSLYEAWGLMRNIANIAFVIAFIFIIYSQVTGVGLSNYGIKKMLPRLVLVAILVNVSYWICALAVDASNIVGANLYGALKSLSDTPALNFNIVSDDDILVTGSNWASITVAILALGAVVMYMWPALILALISVLMAVFTVVVVLTLRQAIVIILIVISPLAFVAYLLPNTEALFKKWLAFLKTMLLMFPIIALVTGGSAFASAIVMKTSQSALIQIMGAAITVLPLFLTPVIMKAAGGVLNRVGGFVNNPNKGPVDRLRKGTEAMGKRAQDRAAARALQGKASNWDNIKSGGRYRRAAKRNAIRASDTGRLADATRDFTTDQTLTNDEFAKRLAGGGMFREADPQSLQRVKSVAELKAEKATAEIVEAEKLSLRNMNQSDLRSIAGSDASDERKIAAMQMTVDAGDFKGLNTLVDSIGSSGSKEMRNALADALKNSKNKPSYISQGDISKLRTGSTISSTDMIRDSVAKNTYSAQTMASADKDELALVGDYAVNNGSGLSTEARQNFVNNANTALTDPQLARQLGKNLDVIKEVKNLQGGDIAARVAGMT